MVIIYTAEQLERMVARLMEPNYHVSGSSLSAALKQAARQARILEEVRSRLNRNNAAMIDSEELSELVVKHGLVGL